ncbi:hypothetical protein FGO68_gene13344 [Halteria grandinella]|uniref:Uncharacterized protein n=1 Tax=Halteria grandinella TaxID=5974 RepID=A0A8J8NH18_HALGN|nr:hypothetical protein FGO68_gene13344 [Halteria grandinella]
MLNRDLMGKNEAGQVGMGCNPMTGREMGKKRSLSFFLDQKTLSTGRISTPGMEIQGKTEGCQNSKDPILCLIIFLILTLNTCPV